MDVDPDRFAALLAARLAAIVPDGFHVTLEGDMLWFRSDRGRFPVASRVSAAVQTPASMPAGTGRPSATESEFSVASRPRTSSPVLSAQLGAGTASRRIIVPV